jgi:hypothetical protein
MLYEPLTPMRPKLSHSPSEDDIFTPPACLKILPPLIQQIDNNTGKSVE